LTESVEQGDFVEVRGRQWLVEAINDAQPDLTTVKLACIADDGQGEQIETMSTVSPGKGRPTHSKPIRPATTSRAKT
jgi:hypothetical protein